MINPKIIALVNASSPISWNAGQYYKNEVIATGYSSYDAASNYVKIMKTKGEITYECGPNMPMDPDDPDGKRIPQDWNCGTHLFHVWPIPLKIA